MIGSNTIKSRVHSVSIGPVGRIFAVTEAILFIDSTTSSTAYTRGGSVASHEVV